MKIICPKCGKRLEAPDEKEGKKGRCPDCREVFMLMKAEKGSEPEKTGGLLLKCGGCGSSLNQDADMVKDKNNNRGYLCSSCRQKYAKLLQPDSIRRFWMCGGCKFRILAGTEVDAKVDPQSMCPNCGEDVHSTLVNLNNDIPVKSGILGEPLD